MQPKPPKLQFKLRRMVKKKESEDFKIIRKLPTEFFKVTSKRDDKNKLRHVVKTGWSHDLNEIIWESKRLPCAWTFKQANMRAGKNDICIKGHCKDCSAKVDAIHDLNSNEINVNILGFRVTSQHKKKRPVSKQIKSKLIDLLDGNSAYAVYSKLANRTMVAGDRIPAHLPNPSTLRKVKSRQITSKDTDPIKAIQALKRGSYRGDIQDISMDPFCVFYCTRLQTDWYNAQFAKDPAILAVDASGMPGLTKVDSCEPKTPLLYQIVARGTHIQAHMYKII